MAILACKTCGTKNRIGRFRVNARPICGKCGASLPEPWWVPHVRQFKKTWPVLAIGLLVVAYLAFRPSEAPQLTTPEPAWSASVSSPTPEPTPTPADRSTLTSQPPLIPDLKIQLPPITFTCVPVAVKSGSSLVYSRKPRLAPLKITTPDDGNYLIKLAKEGTNRVVVSAYIAGGDSKEFKVPLGAYSIYYAEGKVWCGQKDAFGSGTDFYRLVGDVAFTRIAGGYRGHDIELVPRVEGNLESENISKTEFAKLVPDDPEVARK